MAAKPTAESRRRYQEAKKSTGASATSQASGLWQEAEAAAAMVGGKGFEDRVGHG